MKGEAGVTTVKRRASTILHALEEADAQLLGKAVVLADGKAGTVEALWLDESTACASPSQATLESGLSQPSNSRKASVRPDLSEVSRHSKRV